MFILNKRTNVIQECRNKDVIKICKNDATHYQVAERKEDLQQQEKEKSEAFPKKLEDMTAAELRELAKEKGLEGCFGLKKDELLNILKDAK